MLGALEDLLSAYNYTLRDIRFSAREDHVPNRGAVGPIDSRRDDALLRRNKRVGVAREWLGRRKYQVERHWPVFAEILGRVGSHPTLIYRVLRQNAGALTGEPTYKRKEDWQASRGGVGRVQGAVDGTAVDKRKKPCH
jgi:hypothetical protein